MKGKATLVVWWRWTGGRIPGLLCPGGGLCIRAGSVWECGGCGRDGECVQVSSTGDWREYGVVWLVFLNTGRRSVVVGSARCDGVFGWDVDGG